MIKLNNLIFFLINTYNPVVSKLTDILSESASAKFKNARNSRNENVITVSFPMQ